MAHKKAHEVDSWLSNPAERYRIVLIYGPDRGLVSERARRFAAQTKLPLDDPFAVIKFDAGELTSDAGRLIDEARTISMFGGNRLIWLKNTGNDKVLVDALQTLCREPPVDSTILIEAGDLKKGSSLRRLVEQAEAAIALPCYADTSRSIDGLIDDELSKAGLSITLDARQLLKASLGGDRLASRGEIEKLVLYCRGSAQIEPDDVRASIGDVSALSQDSIVDSVLAGDVRDYDRAFSRFVAAGANPNAVLSAMTRQLQQLQLMRGRMENENTNAKSVVASSKPPVFFARRNKIENALSRWNSPLIAKTLERLQHTVLKTRQNGDVAIPTCRQTLLSICLESARLGRNR